MRWRSTWPGSCRTWASNWTDAGRCWNCACRRLACSRCAAADQPAYRRVVLDLDGPTLVRSSEGGVQLALRRPRRSAGSAGLPGAAQRHAGRGPQPHPAVRPTPLRVFTLGDPNRVVIDLPPGQENVGKAEERPAPIDPRLLALLGPQLRWDRRSGPWETAGC